MSVTPGAVSTSGITNTRATATAVAPTGGTTPYVYQWYRSTVSGFTPGTPTVVSGATGLSVSETTLSQGTQYYYKQVITDSNGTPSIGTTTQASVLTTTLTAGAPSSSNIGSNSASISVAPPTLGTTPYSYQWYRSTVSGFTPGTPTILSGKTSAAIIDTGLIPGAQYYYAAIETDSSTTPVAVTSAQLSVLADTNNQTMNQFIQSPYLGMLDLKYNPDTLAAQMDATVVGLYVAGQAVKFTDEVGGVPRVVPCTADTDIVAGFINFNIKNKKFVAGSTMEISLDQNVMFLTAGTALSRGTRVMIAPTIAPGCVVAATTGKPVCGFVLDPAAGPGELIRIKLTTPSYALMP